MEICPFCMRSRPALGSPSLLLTGYRHYLRGVKAAGAGIDHSPASSAGIRNQWTVPQLIHTSVWRGVEHLYLYPVFFCNCLSLSKTSQYCCLIVAYIYILHVQNTTMGNAVITAIR